MFIDLFDYRIIVNIQKTNNVISENLSSIGKALYITEQDSKITLLSFKLDYLILMSLSYNVCRNKFLENLEKIINCRRKRVKVCCKIGNVIIGSSFKVDRLQSL